MVDPLCSVRSNLPFARDISDRADESPGGQDAFAVDDPLRLTVQAYTARGVKMDSLVKNKGLQQ